MEKKRQLLIAGDSTQKTLTVPNTVKAESEVNYGYRKP